jgi:hypothetical protein
MAVSDDVTEIVRILNEEGFGVLAGEVLAEINLGREIVRGWHVEDEDATVSRSHTSEEEQLQQAPQDQEIGGQCGEHGEGAEPAEEAKHGEVGETQRRQAACQHN